ncbi:hypothetical protein ACWHA6_37975 [Streptomyces anthocyanicus]|uniref:hypothetical protein n=1 Tax=Streptomyces anthocyanicus TaxID=68174 RepID=UPI003660DDF3
MTDPTTETDEQRADREETERDHARGDHHGCGVECEAIIPTDHLRNMLLYQALPGAKGALAELERRAADAVLAVLPGPVDRAAVLREEADRIDATRADFPVAVRNGITWATAELRRHAAECPECGTTGACNGGPCPLHRVADETDAEPTAEEIARDHVTTLHLIGEQLTTIEGWFWEHLADVREAKQPAAGARQDEPHHVCNSVLARGHMDEPLGYYICGFCGARKDGAQR